MCHDRRQVATFSVYLKKPKCRRIETVLKLFLVQCHHVGRYHEREVLMNILFILWFFIFIIMRIASRGRPKKTSTTAGVLCQN
jgi:hypothetical protein